MIPENLTTRIGWRRMDRIRNIYQSVYNYISSPENKDYFNEASETVYTFLSSLFSISSRPMRPATAYLNSSSSFKIFRNSRLNPYIVFEGDVNKHN